MAIRRRTDVTNERVIGRGTRWSRSAWAHRRSGTSLGLTAISTSGSFRPRVGVAGRAAPRRRPRVRDEFRAQRDGAYRGRSCLVNLVRSLPSPTSSRRVPPVRPRRASRPCPGPGPYRALWRPRVAAVAGHRSRRRCPLRRPIVQGRARTCRWAGPVTSTEDARIVVTLCTVGVGDGGPSASQAECRGFKSLRPLHGAEVASGTAGRRRGRRRGVDGARRTDPPSCRGRRDGSAGQ